MECNYMKDNKNKRQNLATKIDLFKFVKYKKILFYLYYISNRKILKYWLD